MGRQHDSITNAIRTFIESQPLFFVATAPTVGGHVNMSPKGHDTLRVHDDGTVSYLDLTGSGIETISHLADNGRITLMWCAFAGPPRIVRVQGTGRAITKHDDGYDAAAASFDDYPHARAVIVIEPDRISDSCGYTVPLMDYVGERDQLMKWADRRSADDIEAYRVDRNATSIDGLPGWGSVPSHDDNQQL